ncbi:M48 family metalloprotease [Sphingorhabdus sp. Alg239-R122]|uniref:M48 family metalloprotease n=1 Tax=Sphingorhabdus sp. Alg239-R122 TaxID=2305989 RepID=UPI0013D9B618|nr:M48 family metalloprotease [Sphingorhabdus sp. Alg239-R122]
MRHMQQLLALFVAIALTVQPAAAQSILRDAETEALFDDMSEPLIRAAGLDPRNVDIILIGDKSINAFVAGGQAVYIHSGLIEAADNANEVQGVIAHELGHVVGGHVIRHSDGVKQATGITLLSLVLGAAAIAAGAGEAGMGIFAAGQQAALGKYLAFSRVQESSADIAGADYLSKAGISGRGSLAFFKKLQNLEFRLAIPQDDSYDRTHPLSGERISVLQDVYEKDPAWDASTDPALEKRFQRVKAKLKGFVDEPTATLRDYPEYKTSIQAHYARAYAWHKSAYPDKALAEADALLAVEPEDPYFLELKGQILLESGRPTDALEPLRKAVYLTNNQPLIAALFGHALVATEDKSNFDEAEKVLKAAVSKDNANPFAWYQLGVIYSQQGDEPRARLASAEGFVLQRNAPLALRNAQTAMLGLPEGSPDWIRAQDIAILARVAVEENRKRR